MSARKSTLVPVAWLDKRTAHLAWNDGKVVATNPEFVQNNGPENFSPLVLLDASLYDDGTAWACVKCNSPRSVDPCQKCGTPLTKPADGWEWPRLPDIDRIRALAREVGYAIGVHGSLERDLDLIAVPWVAEAVAPLELAHHIAQGLGGEAIDYDRQDKPCGRWACNIHTPDWTKMIDLSVMPPFSRAGEAEAVAFARREAESNFLSMAAARALIRDLASRLEGAKN